MKHTLILFFVLTTSFLFAQNPVDIVWDFDSDYSSVNDDNDLVFEETNLGWGNRGAKSTNFLPSNSNGSISFRAGNPNVHLQVGFKKQADHPSFSGFDFRIVLEGNQWKYGKLGGGLVLGGYFVEGDICTIELDRCTREVTYTVGNDSHTVNTKPATLISSIALGKFYCAVHMNVGSSNDRVIRGMQLSNFTDDFIDELEYNDESAYDSNTILLQDMLDNGGEMGDGIINLLNPTGESILYIDRVFINRDVNINGNSLRLKRPYEALGDCLENLVDAEGRPWLRYHRMISTPPMSNDVQPESISISNLILDGSILDFGLPFRNWELEQSALMTFGGVLENDEGTPEPERLSVALDKCHFHNSGADGVLVIANVDFSMTNSTATDCFRGGFTMIGGNSNAVVDVFETINTGGVNGIPTGIDIEIDTDGNTGNRTVTVSLNDLTLDSDLDIGVSQNSVVFANDITLKKSPFFINGDASSLFFSNSTFHHDLADDERDEPENDKILWPYILQFTGCKFISNKPEGALDTDKTNILSSCPRITSFGGENRLLSGSVNFYGCEFRSNYSRDDDPNEEKYITKGIVWENKNASSKYEIIIGQGCTFDDSLDEGFSSYSSSYTVGQDGMQPSFPCDNVVKGARIKADGITNNAQLGMRIAGGNNFESFVEIQNSEFNNAIGFMSVDPIGQAENITNTFKFNCVDVLGNANIYTKYADEEEDGLCCNDIERTLVHGFRTIRNQNGDLTKVNALHNDIITTGAVNEFKICIEDGYHHYFANGYPSQCDLINENEFTTSESQWAEPAPQQDVPNCNATEQSNCATLFDFIGYQDYNEEGKGKISLINSRNTCDYDAFVFSWSNAETSMNIEDLSPGNYCVTITRDSESNICDSEIYGNCSLIKCFVVEGESCRGTFEEIDVKVDKSTCNSPNGSIQINNVMIADTEDCEAYELNYLWSDGSANEELNNLEPGKYCVTITITSDFDCDNCYLVTCFDVPQLGHFDVVCTTNILGSYDEDDNFVIEEPGGINAESIEADEGLWYYEGQLLSGISNSNLTNIRNPGTYCFEYYDYSDGLCLVSQCYEVNYCMEEEDCSFCINQPCDFDFQLENSVVQDEVDCESNGSISLDITKIHEFAVDNNCQRVEYYWDNGNQNSHIENLTSGDYCVTISLVDCDLADQSCSFVECFRVNSTTPVCSFAYCYSPIEYSLGGDIVQPGSLSIYTNCSGKGTVFSFNGEEIDRISTDGTPYTIDSPGTYCYSSGLDGGSQCSIEYCFDLDNEEIFCGGDFSKREFTGFNHTKLFPNPTFGLLKIESNIKYKSYSIYDFSGKRLVRGNLDDYSIPLNGLDSGLYILKLFGETEAQCFTEKIVKL